MSVSIIISDTGSSQPLPIPVNITSVHSLSTSPSSSPNKLKKRRKWTPQRDSLAYRRSHGKIGSRRYKRFLNAAYLNDVDFWDMDVEDLLKEQELLTWCPSHNSIFSSIVDGDADDEDRKQWEPFVSCTEEEQEELLFMVCGDDEDSEESEEEGPEEIAEQLFLQIEQGSRQLLKKKFNMRLIQSVEMHLLNIFAGIQSNHFNYYDESVSYTYFDHVDFTKENGLTLLMKSSRDRKVAHGVCQFYGLFSKSKTQHGERLTVIRAPKHTNKPLTIPPILLTSYLENRSKS